MFLIMGSCNWKFETFLIEKFSFAARSEQKNRLKYIWKLRRYLALEYALEYVVVQEMQLYKGEFSVLCNSIV